MGETAAQRKRRIKKQRHREAVSRHEEERRTRRLRDGFAKLGRYGLPILLLVAVVGGIWYVTGLERRAALARLGDLVVAEPNLGRDHRASTTTDPAPTSGPHLGPAPCGVFGRTLDADTQIHSLEHGAVMFQYRPGDVDDRMVDALESLAEEFGSHVVVAPNPGLDEPFVATAWTRKMRLPDIDVDHARDFAVAFRKRGPERVDCDV